MKIYTSIADFKNERAIIDRERNIGFVPTMGALHQGHLSLIAAAKIENDLVICSVFVNPTQFDNNSDLDKYPRTLEADAELLEIAGVDILLAPNKEEVYGEEYFLNFNFGKLETVMEGAFRDGHFNGVATIVSKLFNYVNPSKAYFGQKDLQQVAVIKDLVKALSFDLEVVRCPIVRDENGLALSSRNMRLSTEERIQALTLNQSIELVQDQILQKIRSEVAVKKGVEYFEGQLGYKPEYLEVAFADTLQPFDDNDYTKELAVCIAAPLGPVRLIDNVVFEVN